jgi:hypothetical protein
LGQCSLTRFGRRRAKEELDDRTFVRALSGERGEDHARRITAVIRFERQARCIGREERTGRRDAGSRRSQLARARPFEACAQHLFERGLDARGRNFAGAEEVKSELLLLGDEREPDPGRSAKKPRTEQRPKGEEEVHERRAVKLLRQGDLVANA